MNLALGSPAYQYLLGTSFGPIHRLLDNVWGNRDWLEHRYLAWGIHYRHVHLDIALNFHHNILDNSLGNSIAACMYLAFGTRYYLFLQDKWNRLEHN